MNATIIDPCAEGMPNVAAALRILKEYPRVPMLAYVTPTPGNLKAVFELSKSGLQEVFVHPVARRDRRFANALETAEGVRLARDLLDTLETRLAALPPAVSGVVLDVFQRPHRYQAARDIATEAAVPVRALHARLKRAGLPTAKNMLIVAKAIHAYSYLRFGSRSLPFVTRKLGYSDVRILSRHISRIFGCDSHVLGKAIDPDQMILHLIESTSELSVSRGSRVSN